MPDYRDCGDALVELPGEAEASGKEVSLGVSDNPLTALLVPGIGWNCMSDFIAEQSTSAAHVWQFGYRFRLIGVGALASGAYNAAIIRDAVMALPEPAGDPRLVLIGYSKGASDVLEALVEYPEIQSRVAAVVSLAGSIGGSPLANTAKQSTANLLTLFPNADCDLGDEGAVESLKTSVRREWLATHKLPESIRYYSLVTFPGPDMISALLESSYNDLSLIDQRNDSQVIYYDQIVPGSTILGFLNGDHWSVAVPLNRTHPIIASTLVTRNDFPREVMLEAALRFIDEDLSRPSGIVQACQFGLHHCAAQLAGAGVYGAYQPVFL